MALTLLTAAVLGVAATSGCVGDDCSVKEDGSILLQHRRKEVDLPEKGMAFEGGGFKAHAAHTGVMSGLLGAFYKASAESGEEPNLKKLMRNVKGIASNSGGTWFISQLVYSPSFLTLIETIAANPAQANKQYKEGWIERFLGAVTGADAGIPSVGLLGWGHDVSHPRISAPAKPTNWTTTGPCRFVDNNRILGDVAKIADPYLLNLAEVILELFFLARNASSWEAVVSTLLQSTSNGDMTAKDTLGSKVNEWAEGKWWMAATSMATPGGTGPGNCHWYKLDLCAKALVGSRGAVAIYNGNSTDTKWLYAASTKPTVPNLAAWTPARFSTVLGGGDSEPAPLKFCDAYCDNLKLEYTALGQSVASQESGNFPFFATSDTTLFSVVSASSAFLGETVVLDVIKPAIVDGIMDVAKLLTKFLPTGVAKTLKQGIYNLLHNQLNVWFASAPTGVKAFAEGQNIVNELKQARGKPADLTPQSLAQQGIYGLVDGGLTDNTGIGHALAAGMNEVICIQDGLEGLWSLMRGSPSSQNLVPVPDIIDTCPFCYAFFDLFEEKESDAMQQWHANSTSLSLHGVQNLNSVNVGTLQLTTQANEYFGVKGGREVTLHIVNVNSSIGIGGYNYFDYPALVQDIVDVLLAPANVKTTDMILGWFD